MSNSFFETNDKGNLIDEGRAFEKELRPAFIAAFRKAVDDGISIHEAQALALDILVEARCAVSCNHDKPRRLRK